MKHALLGRRPARRVVSISALFLCIAGTSFSCRTMQGPSPGLQAGAGAGRPAVLADDEAPTGKLAPFTSDDEVRQMFAAWKEQEEEGRKHRVYPMKGEDDAGAPETPAQPSAAPAAPAPAAAAPPPARESAHDSAKGESITNNQHADVDEGDIVKLHGDHLVVLRRGRLFTISLSGGLHQSAMLDAFGPGIDPGGCWYDEMLIEGDDVVVVGFSYARGGTELGLFHIDRAGALRYRATYHVRSNDYYSARNYASRIVDGRLVLYAPMYISAGDTSPFDRFPAYRRWSSGASPADFARTLPATHLYRMVGEPPSSPYAAIHTVTSCDLRAPVLSCDSVGMIGPAGRVFYVSPTAVYVWMRDWSDPTGPATRPSGVLARLPFVPGAGVTAMRVAGMPTDQLSFEEEGSHLNVFVRSEGNGDAMWASETTAGDAALLRVPLGLFSEGVPVASPRRYRSLPRPDGYSVQNRFVGEWLLYGAGLGYWQAHEGSGQLHAVHYTTKDDPQAIRLVQGVERIEAMGGDALVVGSHGSDLVMTPVELGAEAHARRDFVQPHAAQGELRTHGFFYKPTPGKKRDGMIGLPIRDDRPRGAGYLLEGSASVLFLRNHALDLSEMGALRASPLATNDDGCRASCVDWYGNARPIFAKNRVFALMGYELVEGRVQGGSMVDVGRLSFAPRGPSVARSF
jgi:hypothetical protein